MPINRTPAASKLDPTTHQIWHHGGPKDRRRPAQGNPSPNKWSRTAQKKNRGGDVSEGQGVENGEVPSQQNAQAPWDGGR